RAGLADHVFPRAQRLAVEWARAGSARDQWVIDDGDERACHLRPFAFEEVARFAPEGAAGDAASQAPDQRAGHVGIENNRGFGGGNFLRAQLAQRAARGFLPDELGGFEIAAPPCGRVIVTAPLFSTL